MGRPVDGIAMYDDGLAAAARGRGLGVADWRDCARGIDAARGAAYRRRTFIHVMVFHMYERRFVLGAAQR